MKKNEIDLAKNILGEDIFDELQKYEVYKPKTNTVVDPEEIRVALQIVPRSILTFVFQNLKPLYDGDVTDLDLSIIGVPNSNLHAQKHSTDNYSGEITKDGARVAEFQHRSLPSIGLLILTTFELYDVNLLDEVKQPQSKQQDYKIDKLQDIIDDRLMTRKLIQEVVDKRISEREAIDKLIRERLTDHIEQINSSKEEEEEEEKEEETKADEKMSLDEYNKRSKLKQFIENREKRKQGSFELDKNEKTSQNESSKSKLKQFIENKEKRKQESFELDKNEKIKCPDCNSVLYKGGDNITPCICYGEHFGNPIKIKKAENGKIKLKFPKNFDIENIEMLLDTLKKQ